MNSQQRIYDGVISLGINCASTMQVDVRGLRSFSGPLDWLTIDASRANLGWQTWTEIITNQFQVTINSKELSPQNLTATSSLDYLGDILLQDERQGLLFPHDFSTWPTSYKTIQKVQEQYHRRGKRVAEQLTKGGHWLLVFNNGTFSYSTSNLLQLLTTLRQNFPKSQIDLFAVLFEQVEEIRDQEILPGAFITKTRRKFRDSYDFGGRNSTWSWLDKVMLREQVNLQVDLARRESFDCRILGQLSRWLCVDKKTLKLYHKTYKQAYARGYCRFREESWWRCRLPMWLWLKTRKRCFLKLVIALKKA